jgi:hypothetical protein
MTDTGRLRILTWHVHGSYLWYLSHLPHDIYLPVLPGHVQDYEGRTASYDWPDNVIEVPADEVRDLDLDVVVTQSHRNWQVDQHRLCGSRQRQVPRLHIEHDPPRSSPTEEPHPVHDPDALVVHVTHFNQLMWDNQGRPTTVIEHGVRVPTDIEPTYDRARGIVVVNNLGRRGRRLGVDVFERARAEVPLDLFGMNATEAGGVGELAHRQLHHESCRYRFFFNPIRYTSLGLAVCEAMMLGLPVVGLATTELTTVIENGVNGYIDTDVSRLVPIMRELAGDPEVARRMGGAARRTALTRFGLLRFLDAWDRTLQTLVRNGAGAVPAIRVASSG